ncbi:MAG TPA: N-formylglutamate amidohydrolase [Planctomycetota bacterium]|nr:N-formylglutamate amidohydrolase [Planctomycetota bacterium]
MNDPIRLIAGVVRSSGGRQVCDVEVLRGTAADPDAPPDVLFEVSHGATRSMHFDDLRGQLRGDYAADLREFFFVNTDVGAPEVARAVARRIVQAQPRRAALVVCCLLPRTFVDCNRRVDRDTIPAASRPGEMTPGLPPWIREPSDRELLLQRYFAYRDVVTAAFEWVCGNGGLGLFVHTYAPRSVDVPVDENIVANLRAAWAPARIETWPLRADVDLITHDPDGRLLASPLLAQRATAELEAAGFEVKQNATYSLHPVTLAHTFAERFAKATLCLEVRRDLLLAQFTPFQEMTPEPAKVERVAAPLAAAVLAALR